MLKTNHWLNALFALVLIVVPAFVGFYFLLPDWNAHLSMAYEFYWLIALGYLIYAIVISALAIIFKLISVDALRFNIPLALVMIAIFVSYDWHIALRIFAALGGIISAWPLNILVDKIKVKYYKKYTKRVNNQTQKHH